MTRRTRAYWPTRTMLAAPFLLPTAVALLWWSVPSSMGPPMSDDPVGWAGWAGPAVIAVAAVIWLIGVVWMFRIFRGPRDEPPAWRYRHR